MTRYGIVRVITQISETNKLMKQLDYWLIKQAHLIWLVSIINIGIGVIIPGFDFLAKSISHVALEAPVFAIIHRTADIVIGLSMCGFACAISRLIGRIFEHIAVCGTCNHH